MKPALWIVSGHRIYHLTERLPDFRAIVPADCCLDYCARPDLDGMYCRSSEGGIILLNRRLEQPRQALIILALVGLHKYLEVERK